MPVITCFYCSSYTAEERALRVNGDEVMLRGCRKHAKSHSYQRGVPVPPPAPVVGPTPGSPARRPADDALNAAE